MKRLFVICLLFVAMTTAAIAGTGLTIVAQGRTVNVEVVDTNTYNVMVLNDTNRLTETRLMNHNTGTFSVDVPPNQTHVVVMAVNILNGETEKFIIPIE